MGQVCKEIELTNFFHFPFPTTYDLFTLLPSFLPSFLFLPPFMFHVIYGSSDDPVLDLSLISFFPHAWIYVYPLGTKSEDLI